MLDVRSSELAVFIQRLETIADLTEEDKQAIESLPVTIKEIAARNDIVREGEYPTHCFILLEGWAYRYKLRREGARQVMALLIPGDAPDLQSLYLPVTDHNVATFTDVKVAIIAHRDIHDLIVCHPRLGVLLLREILIESAAFREWMVSMGRRTAYERIAHLWCEAYARQKVIGLATESGCPFPIKLLDIADALGLTMVHVSRIKGELKNAGLATHRSGWLTIRDWEGLRAAAEFDPSYLHLIGQARDEVDSKISADENLYAT